MINEDLNNPIDVIDSSITSAGQKIHIRIKQRNGRKSTTTVEGLVNVKMQLIVQEMKNKFHCNGSLQSDGNIMLFGDQRKQAKQYLVENSIATESNIVVHGY